MTIHITQEDIDNGVARSCIKCPIALALNRQAQLNFIYVDTRDRFSRCVVEYDIFKEIDLPHKAFLFMKAFDQGKPVKPFSFELEIPQTSNLRHKE